MLLHCAWLKECRNLLSEQRRCRPEHRFVFLGKVNTMPYVNIQITKGLREQKAQLVKEVTHSLARVLGKKPEHTHVLSQEICVEDWEFAGLLTDEWRKLK
jgi:4-oxalocrotonate tautomerase